MIRFFSEDISFKCKNQRFLKHWIQEILALHKINENNLNYIFCNDNYLLQINKEFLHHDFYTDIITFNNSIIDTNLVADIYISIERVMDNSKKLSVEFEVELHRVMIHGILHLLGFQDKTKKQKEEMRKMENDCLILRKNHYIR